MRVGLAVSSNKFTGAAAVAEHWCRALRSAGHESSLLFVAGANLERRLSGSRWAIPGLTKERRFADVLTNFRALRSLAVTSDAVVTFLPHDHFEAVAAGVHRQTSLVRAFRNPRHLRRDPWHRWLARKCAAGLVPFESLTARTKMLLGGRPVASLRVPVEDRFRPEIDLGEAKERLGMDRDSPVIGMVGKLARDRGFDTLLESAARIRSGCRVLIVGHGEFQPELERQARNLGISGRISWAGKREDDLPLLFSAMNAVVLAAPGSDWGHRAISEAQACACPVIAASIPGIEDLLVHEESGLIADGAESIAAAFDRLIEDPAFARHLTAHATKATIYRRFSAIGDQLASFLEGITTPDRSTMVEVI